MFERFNERARRALFFARYEVTQLGGTTIEPEHLVLGVLHDADGIARVLGGPGAVDLLRARLEAACRGGEKPPKSAEVPFADPAKMAIERAAIEADDLKNYWIRPAHVLLGVMVQTDGAATQALRETGASVSAIRESLRDAADDPADEPADVSMQGVIVRQWKGVVKPGLADDYVRHLRDETFPALRKLAGFLNAVIMRRDVADGTEFQIETVWRSRQAIGAFAGPDVDAAVVPPAAQALLLRYDDRVAHYEIVNETMR